MNAVSSRSHAVFTMTIKRRKQIDETKPFKKVLEEGDEDTAMCSTAAINCVDLAGSERQSKTGATGERLKEATKINLSLSALGNVILSVPVSTWSPIGVTM